MEPTPTAETEAAGQPSTDDDRGFRAPRPEELEDLRGLVDRRVEIFWDGDDRHYSGRVVGFDEATRLHLVKYDDGDEDPYEEDLSSEFGWRVFDGDEAAFWALRDRQVPALPTPPPSRRDSALRCVDGTCWERYNKVTWRFLSR